MNTASIMLLLLAATASIIGTILMFKLLRNSPEGYQDADGFHYGRADHELVRQGAVVHSNAYEHQTAA